MFGIVDNYINYLHFIIFHRNNIVLYSRMGNLHWPNDLTVLNSRVSSRTRWTTISRIIATSRWDGQHVNVINK